MTATQCATDLQTLVLAGTYSSLKEWNRVEGHTNVSVLLFIISLVLRYVVMIPVIVEYK